MWLLKMTSTVHFEISHLPLWLLERDVYFKTLCRLGKHFYLINNHSSLCVLNPLQTCVRSNIPVSLAKQFTMERPTKFIYSVLLLDKDKLWQMAMDISRFPTFVYCVHLHFIWSPFWDEAFLVVQSLDIFFSRFFFYFSVWNRKTCLF